MEVTVKFSHEQEQDAKDYLNAMDENRELLIKYSRIENLADDLITAIEHNRGVHQNGEGKPISIAGVDVPGDMVDSISFSYDLVNAIVFQLEQILEG